jgi:hypothetical protein
MTEHETGHTRMAGHFAVDAFVSADRATPPPVHGVLEQFLHSP